MPTPPDAPYEDAPHDSTTDRPKQDDSAPGFPERDGHERAAHLRAAATHGEPARGGRSLPGWVFVNDYGRLRSGWRLLIFAVAFYVTASAVQAAFVMAVGGRERALAFFRTLFGNAFTRFLLLAVATGVAWVCGRVLEDLPPRAFGWAAHRGWLRDFIVGSLLGVATLLFAVLVGALFGGYRFSFAAAGVLPSVFKALVVAAAFFVVAGAAEEALLRGYPLQTLLRSLPAWVPLALTALVFGAIHLDNPNATLFAFVNTSLAGVWLAVAYLRTRSLWFPTGVHWAWNWALGPVLGLPVSGINLLSQQPLAPTADLGPAWLTGGAYGVEGGAACTVALALSTLFIWRTRLVSPDPEMKLYTDREVTSDK